MRSVPPEGRRWPNPVWRPDRLVNALSRQKAAEVALQAEWEDLIIAADTVVAIDGVILGKPTDERAAEEMVRRLSRTKPSGVHRPDPAPGEAISERSMSRPRSAFGR